MARKKHHEDHTNHEAWAIPYADLMTLLLAFFVVMYAISTINEGKYRVLADALTAAFGGAPRTINPVQVGRTQLQGSDHDRPSPIKSGAKRGPAAPSPTPDPTLLPSIASQLRLPLPSPVKASEHARYKRSQQQLQQIAARVEESLAPLIAQELIVIRRAELWLEVEIKSDILFDTGSAALDAGAEDTVRSLGAVLSNVPNAVRIEGYTDDRPIRTALYPSNWELSSARAASVVHLFVAMGIEPARLAVVGFGEYRPRVPNDTESGRNINRRVVLIILAQPEDSEPDAPRSAEEPAPAMTNEGVS